MWCAKLNCAGAGHHAAHKPGEVPPTESANGPGSPVPVRLAVKRADTLGSPNFNGFEEVFWKNPDDDHGHLWVKSCDPRTVPSNGSGAVQSHPCTREKWPNIPNDVHQWGGPAGVNRLASD